MKKRLIFTASLLAFVFLFANIYSASVWLSRASSKKAHVRFTVIDIEDNLPVYKACVCIPEANIYCYTDNSGNTPLIEVPVSPDATYDNICKKDFGEVSVIVYKEGFCDYVLLNFAVKENEIRQGVKLFIYKQNDDGYTSVVEAPNGKWIETLIDKYKK